LAEHISVLSAGLGQLIIMLVGTWRLTMERLLVKVERLLTIHVQIVDGSRLPFKIGRYGMARCLLLLCLLNLRVMYRQLPLQRHWT